MMVFCTLFDSNYLSRALAMYESLKKQTDDFHLYIFPFDDAALNLLQKLRLPNCTLVPLSDFEDAELLRVKPTRSIAEYCWTTTPSIIQYVLNNFTVTHCTYIDADLFFYSNPAMLLSEMGNSSVLITEHRFTPEYDTSAIFGRYCVQFISFKKDERGLKVLSWWRNACIDWCYDRVENGKFGDQKYLDDWTTRFEGIHVLEHPGGGLAPWNIQQYELELKQSGLEGIVQSTGISVPLIFYHFHYVRFYGDGTIDIGDYRLSQNNIDLIYKPYITLLEQAKNTLSQYQLAFNPHGPRKIEASWRTTINHVKRRIKGSYNIYPLHRLISSPKSRN